MSQADSPNTTSPSRSARPAATFSTVERLNFQSAGAVRTNKPAREKPELLNTPNATYWDTQRSQTWDEWAEGKEPAARALPKDTVLTRHAELVAAIIQAKPFVIRYEADAIDLKGRSEHIEAIGKAFIDYITEIRDDTAYNAPCSLDCGTGALSDAIDDIVGTIRAAADQMAEDAGKRLW